jgi:CRISPR-associated protein Cmr4
MLHKLLYLTAVSPVHNGSGQGLGAIDNPIMRQRDTNLPIIQGSSIKGVLRTEWKDDPVRKSILFGGRSQRQHQTTIRPMPGPCASATRSCSSFRYAR